MTFANFEGNFNSDHFWSIWSNFVKLNVVIPSF